MSVCGSVDLSESVHQHLKNLTTKLHPFLYVWPVAVTQHASDSLYDFGAIQIYLYVCMYDDDDDDDLCTLFALQCPVQR